MRGKQLSESLRETDLGGVEPLAGACVLLTHDCCDYRPVLRWLKAYREKFLPS